MHKLFNKLTGLVAMIFILTALLGLNAWAASTDLMITASDSKLYTENGYPEAHVQTLELTDKSGELLVSGDRSFEFTDIAPGFYCFSYLYNTDFGSDVKLYFDGNEYGVFNGKPQVDASDFSSAGLLEASGMLEVDTSLTVDAVCQEDTYTDTLYSHSFTLRPAVQIVEIENASNGGVQPVEITYRAIQPETGIRKIEFAGGAATYTLNYPVLDGSNASVVFDMNLIEDNLRVINFDNNIEIISAKIYEGNVRRYEAEELSPNATHNSSIAGDGSVFSVMSALGSSAPSFTNGSGVPVTNGHEITYYAPVAGTYNLTIRYYAELIHYVYPLIYVNDINTRFTSRTYAQGGVEELTVSVELRSGENKIWILRGMYDNNVMSVCPHTSNNMYTDYVEITAPSNKISIEVPAEGIYPVKVSYIGQTDDIGAISMIHSSDSVEYKIGYPKYNGEEQYYVVDMYLDVGVNEFVADSKVVSLNIYEENVRLVEVEEAVPGVRTDSSIEEGTVFANLSNLSSDAPQFNDVDGNTITKGNEITYYATAAGTYNVKVRYYSVRSYYAYAFIYVNNTHNKFRPGSYADGVGEFEFTVELDEGENKFYLLRGAYSNVNMSVNPVNAENMWYDYLEITPVAK